jgi:two-component sensor histidine kinase/FixJ family two-component response regulator
MADESVKTSLRVLILEDRAEDAELMVHELQRSGFEPVWQLVQTEADYLAGLGWPPDVILSDYYMPKMEAPRALHLLLALDLDIPFIVVSGAMGEDAAVAIMRQGATDYLLKDRLKRLGPAVTRALEEKRSRDERRQAEKALRASEARFYSFMNNSPALASIKDADGRLLYSNNTYQQVWSRDLPADVAAIIRASDLPVLQSGETSRLIEDIPSGNGHLRHLLSFRFPFDDAAGCRLLGVVSVDITEQKRTEKALATAVAAKEVLLKEVHHRVKNNLQIVSSLLYMQTELLSDPATLGVFRTSQQRVQAMAMVHERLYGQEDVERLDFRDYVDGLAHDLFCSYGVDPNLVRLDLQLSPLSLELNQAIPCGLILNELLTNSLKYAFPEGRKGEISIRLTRADDHRVTLQVADNGIGLPPAIDPAQSKSLGLKIIDILTRQLRGTLHRHPAPGASFTLSFEATQ